MQALKRSVDLDLLTVRGPSGDLITGDDLGGAPLPLPLDGESTFYVLPGSPPALALLATRPVIDEHTGSLLAYVTIGLRLDDAFAQRLRTETGFEQSVVLNGQRVATSLPGAPAALSDPAAAQQVAATGQSQYGAMTAGGARYDTALIALRGAQDEIVALVEVALPIGSLVDARQRALAILLVSTLLIAVLGSGLGALFARRLVTPLEQLTQAAAGISRGDLDTAIPIPAQPVEIATLAAALEDSRANTRRTLDDLSQAKDWSETLIESIVEGVVTFDTAGRVTFFSEGAERITGRPRADVVGRLLDEVFVPAEDGGGPFTAQMPPRGGKREIAVLDASGRPQTLAITGARLIPPTSDTMQIALVFRDVTEEQASRNLRGYFLANITHEFRTPLSALNASIELLVDEAERRQDRDLGELFNSLHLSVLNLQTLIDNLLESSSIEAGRFAVRRKPADLNRIVAEAINLMQPLMVRRQQPLALSEPTRLPPIQADAARLRQVLINLLSNASKYSPPGLPIDLTVEQREADLRVAVADRGPGIPARERDSLFRRFVRLGSADGEQYGVGLGLSVAKAIVESHGGTIGVDARDGGGSVFWFTLPVEKDRGL